MKYRYRNAKTGETVTTSNRVSGKNWELIEEVPKLSSMEETHEEEASEEEASEEEVCDEIAGEETAVDEVPAEKAKTTRRGKK